MGASVAENLRMILAEESGDVIAVGFDEDSTGKLVEILAESEEPPNVRLLVREEVLKWLRDDFVLASTAAELLEGDTLEIRAASEWLEDTLIVAEETVVSLLTPDDEHSAALATDDEAFVEAARERWHSSWEDGEKFDLRTPAYTRVLESLGEKFGLEMGSDFRKVLNSVESMGDEGELDEIEVSLL